LQSLLDVRAAKYYDISQGAMPSGVAIAKE